MLLDGKPLKPGSPTDAISKGLGLLTENRREDGLVPFLSVQTNITLVALQRFASGGWIHRRAETQAAAEHVKRLSIKTPSLAEDPALERRQPAEGADGALAAAEAAGADPVRADAGIDVGSKAEIYRLIDSMAHEGMGVLVMSTELPEIMGIADRIVVMYEGRITGEFTRAEATQERIIAAATGMTGNGQPKEAVAA